MQLDGSTAVRSSQLWPHGRSPGQLPLNDQADIEREAMDWAGLQKKHTNYPKLFKEAAADTPELDLLLALALRTASRSFLVGTGLGSDNVAPRAFCRLSDVVLAALSLLFRDCEANGTWGSILRLVLIVL